MGEYTVLPSGSGIALHEGGGLRALREWDGRPLVSQRVWFLGFGASHLASGTHPGDGNGPASGCTPPGFGTPVVANGVRRLCDALKRRQIARFDSRPSSSAFPLLRHGPAGSSTTAGNADRAVLYDFSRFPVGIQALTIPSRRRPTSCRAAIPSQLRVVRADGWNALSCPARRSGGRPWPRMGARGLATDNSRHAGTQALLPAHACRRAPRWKRGVFGLVGVRDQDCEAGGGGMAHPETPAQADPRNEPGDRGGKAASSHETRGTVGKRSVPYIRQWSASVTPGKSPTLSRDDREPRVL